MQSAIKDKFQILYVSGTDISKSDGPGINEREFIGILLKTFGERIHLIIPRPEYNFKLNPKIVSFVRSASGIFGPFTHLLRQQIEIFRTMRSVLSSKHFDLIVGRIGLIPIGFVLYSLVGDTPFVFKTLGDPTLKYVRKKKGLKGIIAKIIRYPHQWMYRFVVSRAIGVDACTLKLVELNRRICGIDKDKIIHIDNATNTKRFYPIPKDVARKWTGLERFNPIVGYVGSVPWERGGAQMMEAAPKLINEYPNIGFVIVGGGAGISWLQERAQEIGVIDQCVFTGLVPYMDVPMYVNSFNIGIALMLIDKMSYTGNSNQKIRQHIACGNPVVVTGGGNPFIEEEHLGTIVKWDDINGFIEAIEYWLNKSDEEKKEHSRRAVDYAKRHLSVKKALNDRIKFWEERLTNSQTL